MKEDNRSALKPRTIFLQYVQSKSMDCNKITYLSCPASHIIKKVNFQKHRCCPETTYIDHLCDVNHDLITENAFQNAQAMHNNAAPMLTNLASIHVLHQNYIRFYGNQNSLKRITWRTYFLFVLKM